MHVQLLTAGCRAVGPLLWFTSKTTSGESGASSAILLLLDPAQLGNREDADSVMDVPCVLQHYAHRDLAKPELCDHQYSFCGLVMRNIRSTLLTSRNGLMWHVTKKVNGFILSTYSTHSIVSRASRPRYRYEDPRPSWFRLARPTPR